VTRHGIDIREYPLSSGINTGISYSMRFAEFDAAIAAGLDLERWVDNSYPPYLKAMIVAWHNLKSLIDAHQNDAQSAEIDRKSRLKGK
jgi:hypothetical protein